MVFRKQFQMTNDNEILIKKSVSVHETKIITKSMKQNIQINLTVKIQFNLRKLVFFSSKWNRI